MEEEWALCSHSATYDSAGLFEVFARLAHNVSATGVNDGIQDLSIR